MELFFEKDGKLNIGFINPNATVQDLVIAINKIHSGKKDCSKCKTICCYKLDIRADNVFYKKKEFWEILRKNFDFIKRNLKAKYLWKEIISFMLRQDFGKINWKEFFYRESFDFLFPIDNLDEDYRIEETEFYLFMPYKKDGSCLYFDSNTKKCLIHPVKPIICKLYSCIEYAERLANLFSAIVLLYSETALFEMNYYFDTEFPYYWKVKSPVLWTKDYNLKLRQVIEWNNLHYIHKITVKYSPIEEKVREKELKRKKREVINKLFY